MPCTVLAWHRVQPFTQVFTGEQITWLVKLRYRDERGELHEGWHEHVASFLRPRSHRLVDTRCQQLVGQEHNGAYRDASSGFSRTIASR